MAIRRRHQTYIKVAGEWKYLYRAVDRDGDMIDFLLRAKRDCVAARRFLERHRSARRAQEYRNRQEWREHGGH